MSAWQVGVTSLDGSASRAIPWRSNGQLRLTVLTKAAFDFVPNSSMKLSSSPVDDIVEKDVLASEDPTGSVRAGLDLVPFKPRVDTMFWGTAYAPGGIPVPRLQARMAIANQTGITLDKVIDVIGDRTRANPNPVPFVKMPLVFERAYGGPGFAANPIGVGFGPQANILPNLLYPQGWNRDTEPAVFAPIPASWGRRARLMGTQKLDFSGQSVVTIPDELDVTYFQNAPEDQRLASLDGNEWLLLENLHPKHPRLTMRLPEIAGAVMVFGLPGGDKQIPLRFDSLLIDAEREKCVVTCRGSIPIPNEAALDDLRLAAGIGSAGQPLDWTEAKKKALAPTNAAVGTAVLDPNVLPNFTAPYEIAKAGAAIAPSAGAGLAIPGAPFAGAAALLAAAGSVAAESRQGEMTLVAADLPHDLAVGSPFPIAEPPASALRAESSSLTSGLPGAPFAIGGAPPEPTAPVAPLGTTTLPLGDDSFFPPDFDAMLQERTAAIALREPPPTPTIESEPALDSAPKPAFTPAVASALLADQPNPPWTWAQPQAADSASQQPAPPPPAAAPMRPAEPSPRALIYSGFMKK